MFEKLKLIITIKELIRILNENFDTAEANIQGSSDELKQLLENERVSRENADNQLQTNIDNLEIVVNTNKTDSENRDTALDEKVDGININLTKQIDDLEQDVNDKYNELVRDIDDLTDVVEEDFNTLGSKINTEIQDRTNADTTLQNNINTLSQTVQSNYTTLDTKIDTTAQTINTRITNVADELNQTIEENVVALQQEDTALQNQINAHSQTLTAHDTRITNNTNAITKEISDRQSADENLQEQIDGITAGADVRDIVGTYAQLQTYDKSTLGDNDIIKVLTDETKENASTYYRFSITTQDFTYIGKEGPFYTKSETDGLLNDKQDVINDLSTIRDNANAGKTAKDTIDTYGDIVTHNANEFATTTALTQGLETKQNTLVSGTNIKTLNNESLLGSGNIDITSAEWGNITGDLTDQTDLSNTLQNVREVAEGKTKSYVVSYVNNPIFNTQDTEIKLDGTFTDINNITHNIEELKLGDNIFVQETDVPDRWCSQPKKGELPDDYTQLEYIESTGTQWILTNFIPQVDDIVIADVQSLNASDAKDKMFFGQQNIDTNRGGFWVEMYGSSNMWYTRYASSSSTNGSSTTSDKTKRITITIDKNTFKTSGGTTLDLSSKYAGTTQSTPLEIFNRRSTSGGDNTSLIRLYRYTTTRDNSNVLDLIPAKRNSDNKLGLYDIVTNEFYTNQGTDEFVAGDIIDKSVILYKLETSKVDLTDYATKIELNEKQDITDNTLVTLDKTIPGAINELDAKIKEIELYKSPNVLQEGNPTINNGQVTGFTKTDYLILPFEFNVGDRAFELTYAFRTGADVTTAQNLFGSKFSIASYIQNGKLTIRVSSNGTSWDILDLITSLDIQPNTTYHIKLIFNKLSYEVKSSADGVEYSQIGRIVDTRPPFAGDVYIGIGNNTNNPFLGMINLHKWELKYNNSVFWEGMDDAGLATRADISLSNLDEIGQAKFDAKQNKLNQGANITLTPQEDGSVTISASGGLAEVSWGGITGELSNQTDLQEALDNKQNTLVSGTNIKTLNNESLLGEGNIDITSAQWGNITGDIENQTDLQDALDNKTQIIIRRW